MGGERGAGSRNGAKGEGAEGFVVVCVFFARRAAEPQSFFMVDECVGEKNYAVLIK